MSQIEREIKEIQRKIKNKNREIDQAEFLDASMRKELESWSIELREKEIKMDGLLKEKCKKIRNKYGWGGE